MKRKFEKENESLIDCSFHTWTLCTSKILRYKLYSECTFPSVLQFLPYEFLVSFTIYTEANNECSGGK